jgi:hypothetical protein
MSEADFAATIPDYRGLILPILRAVDGGAARLGDVVEGLADEPPVH